METQKHSPLPFNFLAGSHTAHCCFEYSIMDRDGGSVAEVLSSERDTAFIVRACNSHDALVEALKGILELKEFQAIPAPFNSQVYNATHVAALALLKAEGK